MAASIFSGAEELNKLLSDCQHVEEQVKLVKEVRWSKYSSRPWKIFYVFLFLLQYLSQFSADPLQNAGIDFLVQCFYQLPPKSLLRKALVRYTYGWISQVSEHLCTLYCFWNFSGLYYLSSYLFSSFGKTSPLDLQPFFSKYLKANSHCSALDDLILRSYENVKGAKLAAIALADDQAATLVTNMMALYHNLHHDPTVLSVTSQKQPDLQDLIGNHIRALLCLMTDVSSDISLSTLTPLLETSWLSMDSRLNLMICLVQECRIILESDNFAAEVGLVAILLQLIVFIRFYPSISGPSSHF